ncbi:unnamed protein product [marine sediment metagenome]|uniref:50S ribosomal protein L18 n=1 Tax=marine sediment metagenome TaxID=412755 RepID=X0TVP4_9ZZZZ
MSDKQLKRRRRHKRVRSIVKGTAKVPRLCVFRSNKHIYAQLIDDEKGKTFISASDLDLGKSQPKAGRPRAEKTKPKKELTGKAVIAYRVGQILAQKAIEKKLEKIVFDRGGYKYHGRIKALADGAREAGLKF